MRGSARFTDAPEFTTNRRMAFKRQAMASETSGRDLRAAPNRPMGSVEEISLKK